MDLRNSMLLANMMSQNKIMYATIKGTLTENDGVFSEFSVGSCLLTQQEIGNKPFELVAKINLTSTTQLSPIFVGNGNPALTFHIESSKLKMQIGNGSNWVSSILSGTTTISANTDYYVKLVFDGTKFVGYLSSDGINWNKEVEWVNTISVLPIYYLKIGNDRTSSTYYFRGSIDLNNSYIKLGSTKYNLQAIVGYTIVGTPTITDGVVSGFSSVNYLTLPNYNQIVNSIEIVFKINQIPITITNNALICSLNSDFSFRSFVASTKKVQFSYTDINNTIKYVASTNTITNNTYCKFILNQSGAFLYFSSNNLDWTLEYSRTEKAKFSIINNGRIGYLSNTYNMFDGAIDLKETYIKVNDKLWFNGQQA